MANVFLRAAVLTTVVFFIGVQIGVWIDFSRVEEIKSMLTETEVQFNDARLQTSYYDFFGFDSCQHAIDANLEYNDRIYREGLKIESYEAVNKFSPGMLMEREKYALAQFQFWLNSLKIRDTCKADYYVLLHLWKYDTKEQPDIEIPQKVQSAVLLELKEKCGKKLMLSNTPVDINLTSVTLVTKNYNITKMPAIIINKDVVLQGLHNLSEIEKYVEC